MSMFYKDQARMERHKPAIAANYYTAAGVEMKSILKPHKIRREPNRTFRGQLRMSAKLARVEHGQRRESSIAARLNM